MRIHSHKNLTLYPDVCAKLNSARNIQQQIIDAAQSNQALQIIGNNSKAFYGCAVREGSIPLNIADYQGIIDYQPSELTITARAGTPLTEIIEQLNAHGQMLPFEPPVFDGHATLGGCVATALAGPRRPWAGSIRDYILGARVLTGDGKDIRLGGKVMKNVAGYDLFRPMAGALGTLGVMLDITLKLLPLPEQEQSYSMEMNAADMQPLLRDWRKLSMPISASSYESGVFKLRLSASSCAIADASNKLPTAMQEISNDYWQTLNEHELPFFDDPAPLYRLVLPVSIKGNLNKIENVIYQKGKSETLIEWGGSLHWLKTSCSLKDIQEYATAAGGTASVYRNGQTDKDVFMPLPAPLMALHKRIKKVMDPVGILNPGRLYREF